MDSKNMRDDLDRVQRHDSTCYWETYPSPSFSIVTPENVLQDSSPFENYVVLKY